MKEKYNLFKRVLNEPDPKTITVSEIEKMLDNEISKNKNDMDLKLIEELSLTLIELKGKDIINVNPEEKLYKILDRIDNQKCKKHRIPKWATGLAAACLLLVCGNIYTVSAYNKNIFSFVVEFTDGGAIIDFDKKSKEIILPISEDDPYGIIAKCREVGITIETPHYIPEGFILTYINIQVDEYYKYILFTYQKGKSSIAFTFDSRLEGGQVGIPSDEHNFSEIIVNGHTAIVSKEDNQMLVLFPTGDYWFNMFTENVDYEECEKILENIK